VSNDPVSFHRERVKVPDSRVAGASVGTSIRGTGPGGGQIGALALTWSNYIKPGSVGTTGSYNHYCALKTDEILLVLNMGGRNGNRHLGMAGQPSTAAFGSDVFNSTARRH
jgi:hypothetical protein